MIDVGAKCKLSRRRDAGQVGMPCARRGTLKPRNPVRPLRSRATRQKRTSEAEEIGQPSASHSQEEATRRSVDGAVISSGVSARLREEQVRDKISLFPFVTPFAPLFLTPPLPTLSLPHSFHPISSPSLFLPSFVLPNFPSALVYLSRRSKTETLPLERHLKWQRSG